MILVILLAPFIFASALIAFCSWVAYHIGKEYQEYKAEQKEEEGE